MSDGEHKAEDNKKRMEIIGKMIKYFCVLLLIIPLILIAIPRFTHEDQQERSSLAEFEANHMVFKSVIVMYRSDHDGANPESFKEFSAYISERLQNIIATAMDGSDGNGTHMSTFSASYGNSTAMANYTITVDSGNNLLLTSKLQREEDKYIITWDGEKQEKIATGIYEKYCN